ncbi:MAG: glycosyltransferase [Actinomycetes bacterium]
MHLLVLCQEESTRGLLGLTSSLESLGHTVTGHVVAGPGVSDAADLGHRLAEGTATERPGVVLASGWLPGLAAQIATRDTGIPVVQRLFSPARAQDLDRRRLEGALARGAACNVALCTGDVDQLVGLGVRRSSIRIVPHGVDTSVFRDEGPTWPAADSRRVVARPPADRAAIEQLVSLLPSLPRCELVLLTTAATRPHVTSAVSAAVSHHPIAHRVRLLDLTETQEEGHPQPTGTLPALLRSADAVVTTGDDEPELELALEAMACGRPVVARATGAMADVVADGVTGLLVGGSSADAFGDAVRGLLGDELRRESFGFAAGDRARASFAWTAVAPMLVRVAAEVTGETQDELPTDLTTTP